MGWRVLPLVITATLGAEGCVVDQTLKAVDSVPRAVSEASRKSSVSPWRGRYVFSECRPNAPDACWTYEIVVDSEGTATVRADGAELAIHVMSKPEVEDGALRLPFTYYLDGNPDDAFFHSPFGQRKGFGAGALLATIGRNREGRQCLLLAALRSPLGSRIVCAP
jgi:hypothetical protein